VEDGTVVGQADEAIEQELVDQWDKSNDCGYEEVKVTRLRLDEDKKEFVTERLERVTMVLKN
jgi:hypothetical protein